MHRAGDDLKKRGKSVEVLNGDMGQLERDHAMRNFKSKRVNILVNNALFTIILAVVGFSVMGYAGGMFRRNSAYARAVDAGYWLASGVTMVICQGIFRSVM